MGIYFAGQGEGLSFFAASGIVINFFYIHRELNNLYHITRDKNIGFREVTLPAIDPDSVIPSPNLATLIYKKLFIYSFIYLFI